MWRPQNYYHLPSLDKSIETRDKCMWCNSRIETRDKSVLKSTVWISRNRREMYVLLFSYILILENVLRPCAIKFVQLGNSLQLIVK